MVLGKKTAITAGGIENGRTKQQQPNEKQLTKDPNARVRTRGRARACEERAGGLVKRPAGVVKRTHSAPGCLIEPPG